MGYYVAQTHPNAAEKAKRNLLRQGLIYYDPRESIRVRRKGKTITQSVQLFQNYIFVAAIEQWSLLCSTVGIRDLLRLGEKRPAVIADDVIREIRMREDIDGYVRLPKFEKGQKVIIQDGPMKGCVGLYDGQTSGERVAILFSLGRVFAMENDLAAA